MILLAELMILVFLGTLAVQGVDFRENHACQNRRQTAMISFAELLNFMVLGILAVQGVDFREKACLPEPSSNSYDSTCRIDDFGGFGDPGGSGRGFLRKTMPARTNVKQL